jgi:UDP-galactopyranose mutase
MQSNGDSQADRPHIQIVGAGLSGAVLARVLAEGGCRCDVFEEHDFVGGHCHTERDRETGVLVHRNGPHTLHTDDAEIWRFVERFAEIFPYRHVKRARVGNEIYPLPINLQTLNQFYRCALSPADAKALVASEAANAAIAGPPTNFEEMALSKIGRRLYEAFYRGYTIKQWGIEPKRLPAYIFERLPVRLDYDQNYFHHSRQGQPIGGYTAMIDRMLGHENITVNLKRPFDQVDASAAHKHVFYSGPIDRYFGWRHGRLSYRTLRFEDVRTIGDFQGCAVFNYCDEDVPFTRVTEHKHFSGWEKPEGSVVTYEYSLDCGPRDVPFYPLRLTGDRTLLDTYISSARATEGISFIGRLGTYRYIDMDRAIREAIHAATVTLAALKDGSPIPPFFVEP